MENLKNAPYHGKEGNVVKSKAPKNGQKALDNSVQVKNTFPRRVGVSDDEIVILDQTREGIFHGHVRQWRELTAEMQNVLKRSGKVDKKGNLANVYFFDYGNAFNNFMEYRLYGVFFFIGYQLGLSKKWFVCFGYINFSYRSDIKVK